MSETNTTPSGPDLSAGVPTNQIPDGGMLAGHVGDAQVLLARIGDDVFAIGSQCTHYGGPLGEGLMVGDTVRCPWHHACFSLRTGEALRAPALKPVSRWRVDQREGTCYVTTELTGSDNAQIGSAPVHSPASVVIVGAGGAGNAAAEMLRRKGYQGPVTMIGQDDTIPYDRPNLSKDYLAGNAPEEWIPLRDDAFYQANDIAVVLNRRVTSIDPAARVVALDDASTIPFGALLLATGAEPRRLPASVDVGGRVQYLRTLADSRAIISRAKSARRAVVIGASFIGLEVAASLRARNIEVDIVAPDAQPLARVLGQHLAQFIRALHEKHGVRFHLERNVTRIDPDAVVLDNEERLPADLVVAGIGVTPNESLAAAAGIAVDNGIVVNNYFETSVPGIYAAGDVARYPDVHSGANVRIEHWVTAERQGQVAARNILGAREMMSAVPFFWSQHYDVAISYVGHAERWTAEEVSGNAGDLDCAVTYREGERVLALATIGRDRLSLETEARMEQL
jgi:apoptosis-inducing factor 3